MHEHIRLKWAAGLDGYCAVMGGLLPLGLVIGNVGFELVVSTVVLFWIVRSVIVRQNPWPKLFKQPLVIPWLAWLAIVYISLLWNGAGNKGWGHDIALIRYFLYVAALIDISGRKPLLKYFLIGMAAAVLWGLINTLLAYAIGFDMFGRSLNRYSWKIKDASRISSVAAYVGPFFIVWGLFDRRLLPAGRALVVMVGAIAMGQLFFIQVRTVEVAAITGIFAACIYVIHKRFGVIYTLSLGVGGAVMLWLFLRFGPKINLDSIYDRIGYWKVVWTMWRENPILGVSVSGWQDAYKAMASSNAISPFIDPAGRSWKALEAAHAHSLYLQILSSTGLLGLAGFLWLFVAGLRLVIRKIKICGHALLTWPVIFLVIGLTGWNIYGSQYQTLFAFFMALTVVSTTSDFHVTLHRKDDSL